MRFQPGEGHSRGHLHLREPSNNLRFKLYRHFILETTTAACILISLCNQVGGVELNTDDQQVAVAAIQGSGNPIKFTVQSLQKRVSWEHTQKGGL